LKKLPKKVGEVAVETVIEALRNNNELFLNESADLLFHYFILLQAKGKNLDDELKILEGRRR
jgi:phosphoribosyl-ATP pyrophosphohydrolase/phosphoribosyl-AMP cyclohydrolase